MPENPTYEHEIRYFSGLPWPAGRYQVYEKGYEWYLIGGALTKWGARRVIARRKTRDQAKEYTVVEGTADDPR